MNIPGFTAETSLYNASGHYRAMAGPPNTLVNGRGVLPQLFGYCNYSMSRCCIDATDIGGVTTCCTRGGFCYTISPWI
jgi:hypothetical protein